MGKEVPVSDYFLLFFYSWPVFSSTHSVTEVQSSLTSSANRVSYVESGHQELCCLKHLSSYFLPPSQRDTEGASTNLSVTREILHFNPKLTKTIPLQFKFYFFLNETLFIALHGPNKHSHGITVQTKAKKLCKEEELLEEWNSQFLLYFMRMSVTLWLLCSLTRAQQWLDLVVRYRSVC